MRHHIANGCFYSLFTKELSDETCCRIGRDHCWIGHTWSRIQHVKGGPGSRRIQFGTQLSDPVAMGWRNRCDRRVVSETLLVDTTTADPEWGMHLGVLPLFKRKVSCLFEYVKTSSK